MDYYYLFVLSSVKFMIYFNVIVFKAELKILKLCIPGNSSKNKTLLYVNVDFHTVFATTTPYR